jgi:antitoxin-like ribbon-helix-helix protein
MLGGMLARSHPSYVKRKLIEFAPELWLALEMLAKDTGRNVQDLADEAFADLLGKYQRPASLKDALRESARRLPANDDLPSRR